MKFTNYIFAGLSILLSPLAHGQINVNYNITPQSGRSPISPLIYGFNWTQTSNYTTGQNYSLIRMGGNRATAYNWENNASNAGTDWNNSSDNFWCDILGITSPTSETPGIAATTFIDQAKSNNGQALITIPLAGYVSADKSGNVTTAAPGSRWCQLIPAKGSAFSLTPDLTDGKVYADEFVNFLKNRYGAGGVKYCLDNEPDLWYNTHPLVHPNKVTCQELIDKTTVTANAIKAVDGSAEIFGFVSFGFGGYYYLVDAPDWNTVKGSYSWYIDYYLDKMRIASTASGKRLVDVLDLHWYPEATGDQRIINSGANSNNDKMARLQAPRSLWDSGYVENSWIGQSFSTFLPIIPRLQSSINTYNPGTKLAFTEFQYGGFEDVTGAISLADVLGIFGKYGVYAATHWDNPGSYGSLAYKLFRNYDGNKSTYGDVNVGATMTDKVNSSIYASVTSSSDNILHIIVLNKSMTSAINGTFTISGGNVNYTSASVYAVTNGTPSIINTSDIAVSSNAFTYSLPALSAYHFILKSGPAVRVSSVSVAPPSTSVNIGLTTILTPTVLPTNATDKSVSWTSSNTNIASVNSSGVVTGVALGDAIITVKTTDGGFTATSAIKVIDTAVHVTSISVAPPSASVNVGSTTGLVATVLPTNATDKSVSWSSSDTTKATVSSSGVVTGVAAGDVTITAKTTDGGFTASSAIKVIAPTTPCSNPATITISFTKDGIGEFCWVTSQSIAFINSWNLDLLEVNGVNLTNAWSNTLPARINGNYYIHYKSSFPWGHFEAY